jgi:hypothetical protein
MILPVSSQMPATASIDPFGLCFLIYHLCRRCVKIILLSLARLPWRAHALDQLMKNLFKTDPVSVRGTRQDDLSCTFGDPYPNSLMGKEETNNEA